ncbi:unnamed protein product [Effrenium voratum]|nr:unnamed protein product [Effrenium voratum]
MAGVSPWSAWSLLRVLSSCADGHPHDAEECDDGNMVDGDGCSTSCKVELGWTCEAQPLGLYADGWGRGPSKCRASGIDGLRVGDEECDDCNLQAGDGCDNGRVEPGYTCDYKGRLGIESPCPGVLAADTNNYLTFTADSCHVTCGDGIRHIVAGEECDDGNVINGDGCTSDCRIEPGYECPTIGWPAVLLTPCRPICGDGLRRGTEACDDNNTVAGDGCWDCKVEIGWFCKRIGEGEGEEVCRNTCLNGDIDPGEDCDDANTFDNDGCSNCIIEQGWTCEAIANRPTSTGPGSFCTPICGDGLRIELGTLAEQCDDGNFLAGDGCSPDCQVEPGWQCVVQANSTALRCEQTCGDGLLAPGEQCDDGNKELGDGCDNLCRVERGFVCTPEDAFTKSEVSSGPPFAAQNRTVCQPICGDGLALLSFGEACDDGNRVPSDGCDESCQVEAGYTCGTGEGVTAGLSLCTPICGDSLLRAPEQCDDGNAGKGDGCDETCQLEQGYQCWPPGVACRPLCGDSLRLEGEACDDGNLQLEDGCDSSCQVEDGWACRSYIYAPANTTSVCAPICGDGKLRGGEACDDGNLVQGDGCDQNCAVEDSWVCCDPAPGTTGSKCSPGFAVDRELICGAQTCGDGRRDDGEGCDDGNNISADGCSPRCEVDAGYACTPMAPRGPGRYVPDHCEAICGDGLLVQGEECDDGNQVSGDGCGWNCKIEQLGTSCPQASDGNGGVCRATCGDGVRGPVEECDDGNSFGGDGCSASCQIERGFTCSGGGLRSMDTCWPICGDGLRVDRAFSSTLAADKLEACDTGPIPSRGCDISTCTVRAGWTCSRPAEGSSKEVCTPICGDGILMTPMEECDDNNNQPGDGCSPDCKVEPLYECAYDDFWLRSVCSIRCGDGRRHPSEACDDGNNWDQDGCSSTCQPEPGFECHGGTLSKPSQCRPICGDGFEVLGESCDDGNLIPWDGCNQFCQVEAGYYCTKAPRPENPGSPSQCTNSCGDGIVNDNEECDDGIAEGSESATCSKCRRLPAAVCGDFRRSASEQCDDGNTVTGDGCSPSCEVEPGWTCTQGPQHLDPRTGPGDSCAPVCGDGLVIAGLEACDDGNLRGDDGCTADCQVEPLFQCFLLGASELSQVPAAVQPVRGPDASICVPTTPPRLVGAYFGEALVTLKLNFDTKVAPLPGEEYVGGVALAAASFPCNVLLAESTLLLLGTQPSCWWESRSTAAVALGGSPGLAPGSSVVLKAGVLRRYIFTQEASPSQELKADVPGGFIAPVLWPQPVITGPQMVPSCADSTTLSSEHSQGLAGRMPLPNRWDVVAAFNIKNGTWDDKEVQRIRTGIASQAQSTEVTFPRQGAVLSLLDLEFDRSLRVNYLYRICLTQQNLLGLSGVACHHLEVNDFPVPSVAPVAPSTRYVIPKYGRWLNLETTADIPKGCLAGDAPLPTTFLAREVPKASHDLSVEEPMVRAGWAYDASMRNVGQERATLRTPSVAQPLGEDRWGNRSVSGQIFVPPGTLAAGFADVLAVACINASTNLSLLEMSLGMPSYEQVCGYYTFRVHVVDVATGISLSERPARRLNVTEAALARAELRLVGLAPELGLAPQGPPLQADESRPWALQRLEVLQDLSGNQLRADFLQYGWLGAIEPENSTTVLGAVLALTNDTEFTQSQLQAALAEFTPLVTWSVQAETRSGAQVVAEPLTPSVGGVFLSLPPGQLSSGSQVQVTAQLDLLPGLGCSAPVRSLQKQATLRVNLPPAAGYLLVDRTRVAAPAPLMSFIVANMRWSSAALPLQYRLEAELPTGLLLSDWSFDPKVPVAFLPRDQTLVLRGQARDGRGTVAVTAPETVQLMASATAEAQALRVLAAFQQGQMLFAQYSPRKTSETLSLLQSTASSLDPMLQWQLWQDVAFSALSTRFDSSVQNCTEDCGAHGSCFVSELLDQSWDRCTCADGWLGSRCELRDFEAESQKLVTLAVLDALQKLATQLEVLGINSVAGSLGRFFQLLRRVADDCRRVPLDGLASLVGIAAGLAAQAPKAALRDARVEMTALISQLYSCLPEEDPSMPMASMPAPATVLLTSLGSSEICRPVNGTNTTVCYDLASSEVRMSCPGTAQKAYQGEVLSNPSAAAVQSDVHCRADLNLGIADPYPCPCTLPDSTFLGFGRSERQPLLSETLGARDEKDILWRELVRLFWNNTKYGGSGVREQPGPVLAAALWLQETGAAANEVTSALAEAERWQLVQQGILMALQSMAPLLADALLGAAVPGQEPHLVESQPVDMHWAVPTVMSTDGPPSRTWVAAMSLDTPTQVETEYQTLDPVSGPQPQTLPVKVPLGAVHWKNGGRGLFSKIDPSVKVHSDVVQLRLLEASRYNLTKLRYRFKVPDLQPRCVPPTEDLLLLCCNASNWTDRPGAFAFACPTFSSPLPVANPARRVASTAGTPAAPIKVASVLELSGQRLPFEQGLESLMQDVQLWTQDQVLIAGSHLRMRGGDLKVARACDSRGNAASRLILREGRMLEQPSVGFHSDAWCRAVFARAEAKRASALSWQTFQDLLLEAAHEVLADPLLIPSSTTSTISRTTTSTSTSSSYTTSSSKTSTSTTTVSTRSTTSMTETRTSSTRTFSTVTSTTTTTGNGTFFTGTSTTSTTSTSSSTSSNTTSSTSSTRTSSSTSSSSEANIFSGVNSTTTTSSTRTTRTSTSTTVVFCVGGEPPQIDTWCPSGVTSEDYLPVYADVELLDPDGILLFGVSAVQLSLNESTSLAMSMPGGKITMLAPTRSIYFVHAMAIIYDFWVSWQELHELANVSQVLRPWRPELPTSTVTSTTTFTSTSATSTTSTNTPGPFPQLQPSSSAVLGALEIAFSDPLEVLSRALAFELQNSDGTARSTSEGSWAERGLAASDLLSSWCQVPSLAPAVLSDIFASLDPVVGSDSMRPLQSMLQSLDEGLPSWWNESFWAESAGGPDWQPPIPQTTTPATQTRTSTTAVDLRSFLCSSPFQFVQLRQAVLSLSRFW